LIIKEEKMDDRNDRIVRDLEVYRQELLLGTPHEGIARRDVSDRLASILGGEENKFYLVRLPVCVEMIVCEGTAEEAKARAGRALRFAHRDRIDLGELFYEEGDSDFMHAELAPLPPMQDAGVVIVSVLTDAEVDARVECVECSLTDIPTQSPETALPEEYTGPPDTLVDAPDDLDELGPVEITEDDRVELRQVGNPNAWHSGAGSFEDA
jgi:hypothetical protein